MSKDKEIMEQLNPVSGIQQKIDAWRGKHGERLMQLAGNKEKADKFFVICLNTISKNPNLLSCNFETLAGCILQSFQLGLMPGVFQECAYVPLNSKKKLPNGQEEYVLEANFWLQYQGLVKLLMNAGNKAVIARVVFENDYFGYKEGHEKPDYAPAVVLGKTRGKPLFCYAAVCTAQDMWQVEVMSPEQVEVIKSRSKGAKAYDSPWNSKFVDDVYAMWAKTVLKRVSKWCTKSAELVSALEADESDREQAPIIDLVNNFRPSESKDHEVIPEALPQPKKTIEIKKKTTATTPIISARENAEYEPRYFDMSETVQANVSQADMELLNK